MKKNKGFQFGSVKCRNTRYEAKIGTRKRNVKGKNEPVIEDVYETFWLLTPIGYCIKKLRVLLTTVVASLLSGERKEVALPLFRYPQVNTVMGEINASLPKGKRLKFGYTTKEEANYCFTITKA